MKTVELEDFSKLKLTEQERISFITNDNYKGNDQKKKLTRFMFFRGVVK